MILMHCFFKKVNSDSEKKSGSQFTSTPLLIKQVVTTDKNLEHNKAINRKQQAVNGFSATNPDRIKQLESHPPKGNWCRFNLTYIRASEIFNYQKLLNYYQLFKSRLLLFD